MVWKTVFGFVSLTLLAAVHDSVFAEVVQNDDGSGTIKFSTPQLDDEDHYSMHLPDDLKCDGCRAVAYSLSSALDNAHKKRPSLKRLPESQMLDIFETTCEGELPYGLKDVKGVRRLSGPGLETNDIPGVTQGGGKWPLRLREICSRFVGELGEEELYEAYLDNPVLETFLCYGEGLTGDCSKSKEKEEL